MKDSPADRRSPRERLRESLDAIFKKEINPEHAIDSVEPKLFGIGAESFTPGSHEFYLAYATRRGIHLTLDSGHYHPTESIADKISATLEFLPGLALHISRGVRWDSDHVVTLSDDLLNIAHEIVWSGGKERIRIGLDYFDASINRVAAWVIGARNLLKALLIALLSPVERLKAAELEGDYTTRLALMEECKSLPWAAVWERHCEIQETPPDSAWLAEVQRYEKDVLSRR
jgi:L-rhamnose isomerase